MDDTRTIHVQDIRERLVRDEYVVDERKVAEAIISRLLVAAGKRP